MSKPIDIIFLLMSNSISSGDVLTYRANTNCSELSVGQKILIQKNIIDGDDGGSNEESDAGIQAKGILSSFEWVCNSFSDNLIGIILNDDGLSNIYNPVTQPKANNTYSSTNYDIEFNTSNSTELDYISSTSPSHTGNGQVNLPPPPMSETNCVLTCSDIELILNTEQLSESGLGINPNPADKFIVLKATEEIDEYFIYQANGSLLSNGRLSASNTIDISNLTCGFYYIRILTQSTTYSGKFIKCEY